ncbi:radical SAM domain-containing protein [Kribbella qitaiheensis]|uniref:Radical SAM domain-containing protein n=1 Tax=Kribbella qitaiheensis TaxID=1544730 RepID=A0A7G6WW81_9ACTN|nr:radical SAM domain-containing protein [Kribbella qitaiheensis]QNE18246.1 radical SAM domain-containing protein [Kribbella qitaiheensis]
MRLLSLLHDLEVVTRPVHPETRAALDRRWVELPEAVRTPAQALGQHAVGCEGTHGVFPRCNLACTPCYHSRDANRVAVSGSHTQTEVAAQMSLLRTVRGPRAHAQLIGGEVSLLPADDHAAALQVMIDHGRQPMSMSHGDFDYDYLRDLALGPEGKPRLKRLSFAGHFDMLMFGRRGIERPADEASLNLYRQRFADMFKRLKREHGVRYFLAHNMTVTPRNLDQIAAVIRDCKDYGFGLFSFQPAAFLGDDRRWHESYRDASGDEVWAEVEKGAGCRLPFRALQIGDERCNRTTYGFFLGQTYHPILDDENPADLAVRDTFFRYFGGVSFSGTPLPLLTVKIARVVARHPSLLGWFGGWLARTVRKAGLGNLLRHRIRPVTFVMHSFMDAADVAPAWAGLQAGRDSSDPRIAATQQRLLACSYAMAHPETGELVPACVQHSVLDPAENIALRRLLPLTPVTGRSAASTRPGSSV